MRLTTLIKTFGALAVMTVSTAVLAQEAATIAVGDSIDGALADTDRKTEDGDVFDAYAFQAAAGDRVKIAMTAIDGTTEDDLDPLLRVGRMTADGFVELAMNDDEDGLNAGLVFTVAEAGAYVIHAEALEGEPARTVFRWKPAPNWPAASRSRWATRCAANSVRMTARGRPVSGRTFTASLPRRGHGLRSRCVRRPSTPIFRSSATRTVSRLSCPRMTTEWARVRIRASRSCWIKPAII